MTANVYQQAHDDDDDELVTLSTNKDWLKHLHVYMASFLLDESLLKF